MVEQVDLSDRDEIVTNPVPAIYRLVPSELRFWNSVGGGGPADDCTDVHRPMSSVNHKEDPVIAGAAAPAVLHGLQSEDFPGERIVNHRTENGFDPVLVVRRQSRELFLSLLCDGDGPGHEEVRLESHTPREQFPPRLCG